MINLMYIVLTAMLALNVSSDVLDGFTEVEKSVMQFNDNAEAKNAASLESLATFSLRNKEKGGKWYEKAIIAKNIADSLIKEIDKLKLEIVRKSDGDDGCVEDIKSREDLEAASAIMLSPIDNKGEKLQKGIELLRSTAEGMIADPQKRESISSILSTSKDWSIRKFENKPVAAAITILSQLQSDILLAEGEVLSELIGNIDAGEVRVNKMQALVLPKSDLVMNGDEYVADIVVAAVDSTRRPLITVNGKKMDNYGNTYKEIASGIGEKEFDGSVEIEHPDGSVSDLPFTGKYTVLEPMATVSSTLMNVLYCGIDNQLSISVSGIAPNKVIATMSNGDLTRQGNMWIAKPYKADEEAEITVTADINGRQRHVARHRFRVRRLPDPTAFITFKETTGEDKFSGGKAITRAKLLSAEELCASIDDGILDIAFKVKEFETIFFDSMGNAITERSNGAQFSQRQKDMFKRLGRGKRLYISNIQVAGPDDAERRLSPLEVIIK